MAQHTKSETQKASSPRRFGLKALVKWKNCANTPLLHELSCVGCQPRLVWEEGITTIEEDDDSLLLDTSQRPDLHFKRRGNLYFVTKTPQQLIQIVPPQLHKAGDGLVGCIESNEERIKSIDAWIANVWFPNQGRGVRTGLWIPPHTQTRAYFRCPILCKH